MKHSYHLDYLYFTEELLDGMRPGLILQLLEDRIDHVYCKYGHKPKTICLSKSAVKAIKEYLEPQLFLRADDRTGTEIQLFGIRVEGV